MTEKAIVTDFSAAEPILPSAGDIVCFGEDEDHLYFVTMIQANSYKLIGLRDGNRWSDDISFRETIVQLIAKYGEMRIAVSASICVVF